MTGQGRRLSYRGRTVLLKSHRLLDGLHPHRPNSVAALRCALSGGAEAVEFDIAPSRDGKFVLAHDTTLEHETDGQGPLRVVTEAEFKRLRLRGGDEPAASLADAVELLGAVERPVKVQLDLKETAPLSRGVAAALLDAIAPLRDRAEVSIIVGCMADWNLRLLRRLDPALGVGLDFGLYLDVSAGSPERVNAYGYVDDHPLGSRRLLPVRDYLEDRLEVLLGLVPNAREIYLRKELLLRVLSDGVNPVAFIHGRRPGMVVDVWTFYADDADVDAHLLAALESGADQITSPDAAVLAERFGARWS